MKAQARSPQTLVCIKATEALVKMKLSGPH